MNSSALMILAVAAALAGCQHVRDTKSEPAEKKPVAENPFGAKCEQHHPVCNIRVTVDKCKVSVLPDAKRVSMRPDGVLMKWHLEDSPGVTFAPADGIAFKPPAKDFGDGARVFRLDRRQSSGTVFAMHNRTEKGEYRYSVNVLYNGKRCPEHDPGVINEM